VALIEVSRFNKKFRMGSESIHALVDVSFKIEEGELLSVMGPSGCGKSTLMNILGLLDQPDSGQYLLDKRSVQELTDDERARLRNEKIGFVFQNFNLIPRFTALRNVEIPLVYAANYEPSYAKTQLKDRALEALKRVSLLDRKNHRPNELSGGQRQRVAIARAIVNRPKILLADGPTGNLDSKSGKEILDLFQELNLEGVTVVIVTHESQVASHAKRVISMFDGQIKSDTYATS